jgi:hypothetical protein
MENRMRASHRAAGFAALLIMLGSPSVHAEVLIGSAAPAADPDG